MSLFVGSYGGGIRHLSLDDGTDLWRLGRPDPMFGNMSYAVAHPNLGLYYMLDEKDKGTVRTVRATDAGWEVLFETQTGGDAPCFADIAPSGGMLAVANYKSGSIAFFSLTEDGQPSLIRTWQNSGRGPNAERQEGPHAHCVRFSPDGRLAFSTDLGTDEVLGFSIDRESATVKEPFTAFRTQPGEGARHIVVHPTLPRLYLVTELGSRLHLLDIGPDGHLSAVQSVSTLPAGVDGESLAGQLELDAKAQKLYVTNRGHDSLAVFSLEIDGQLKHLQTVPTCGASPRHFLLSKRYRCAIVAHQNSDSIDILDLAMDGTVGERRQTLALDQPAFIGCLESQTS